MKDALNELFQKYDAIATPGRATVAYPVHEEFSKAYPGVSGGPPVIPAGNLCGLPAICIGSGFGEGGMPTSIAFMGPAFSEASLITMANDVQTKLRVHEKRPVGIEG